MDETGVGPLHGPARFIDGEQEWVSGLQYDDLDAGDKSSGGEFGTEDRVAFSDIDYQRTIPFVQGSERRCRYFGGGVYRSNRGHS